MEGGLAHRATHLRLKLPRIVPTREGPQICRLRSLQCDPASCAGRNAVTHISMMVIRKVKDFIGSPSR